MSVMLTYICHMHHTSLSIDTACLQSAVCATASLSPSATDPFTCCYSIFLIFEQLYTQTARDSAIKRANDLQKQFSDLYKDHEKLRKVKVSELHGRVSFTGEQFITCGSDVNGLSYMSFAEGFNRGSDGK